MTKRFRATQSLNMAGGFIRAGEIVPESYERTEEALARGWIEPIGDTPPPSKLKKQSEKRDYPEALPEPETVEAEPELELDAKKPEKVFHPPSAAADVPKMPTKKMEDLTLDQVKGLTTYDALILKDEGLVTLSDLADMNTGDLQIYPGITFNKARALFRAYKAWKRDNGITAQKKTSG